MQWPRGFLVEGTQYINLKNPLEKGFFVIWDCQNAGWARVHVGVQTTERRCTDVDTSLPRRGCRYIQAHSPLSSRMDFCIWKISGHKLDAAFLTCVAGVPFTQRCYCNDATAYLQLFEHGRVGLFFTSRGKKESSQKLEMQVMSRSPCPLAPLCLFLHRASSGSSEGTHSITCWEGQLISQSNDLLLMNGTCSAYHCSVLFPSVIPSCYPFEAYWEPSLFFLLFYMVLSICKLSCSPSSCLHPLVFSSLVHWNHLF